MGDSTSVAGFRPLGFDVLALDEPADARELWGELAAGEYAVVLVTEPVWAEIADLAAEVMDHGYTGGHGHPRSGEPRRSRTREDSTARSSARSARHRSSEKRTSRWSRAG